MDKITVNAFIHGGALSDPIELNPYFVAKEEYLAQRKKEKHGCCQRMHKNQLILARRNNDVLEVPYLWGDQKIPELRSQLLHILQDLDILGVKIG